MKLSQKVSRLIATGRSKGILLLSGAVLVGGSFIPSATQMVRADSISDQISQLQQKNADAQSSLNSLVSQAASYQDAISQLQQQINGLQASINANLTQQASLQQQITDDQNQINQEKAILADDVKTMYVDGTPSTLEMLATSNNLSDFVDKQEYRTSVQNKLQDTLTKIAQLQSQLQTQKSQVDELLKEQQSQQTQLSDAKAQQASLLSYNQSQQATYNAQIKANSAQITKLRAEQAAANATLGGKVVAGDPGHGGYPAYLDSAPQDSLIDPWGMYNRECVSYAAWKVQQTYGHMPYWGGHGNAIQWPGDARSAGIPVSDVPQANTVAIWPVGVYGHAMWVEDVTDDGIYVSQYNYDYTGHYSEMYYTKARAQQLGFEYIYFNSSNVY